MYFDGKPMKLVPYILLVQILIFSVGDLCSPRILLNRGVFQGLTTIQEKLVGELKQSFHSCKKFRKVLENFRRR